MITPEALPLDYALNAVLRREVGKRVKREVQNADEAAGDGGEPSQRRRVSESRNSRTFLTLSPSGVKDLGLAGAAQ